MARPVGQLETTALACVQMRNLPTVATGQLTEALSITTKQKR